MSSAQGRHITTEYIAPNSIPTVDIPLFRLRIRGYVVPGLWTHAGLARCYAQQILTENTANAPRRTPPK